MRFDLVDLQLFIAVAETRSITAGAARVHLALASACERIKGLELALGVALLKRGRRGVELTPAGESLLDHARVVHAQCRGHARRSRVICQRRRGRACICSPTPRACRNICRRRLPPSLPRIRASPIDVEERESGDIARAIAAGAADLGLAAEHALPEGIERIPFQRGPPGAGGAAAGRTGKPPPDRFRRGGRAAISSASSPRARCMPMSPAHAAKLGARLRFRARLNNFDAIGQMVAAGIGVAVMPEVAARRCARAMKIGVVRLRDAWANRRLVICARSFKALPKPAQQLVEHLRKAARREGGAGHERRALHGYGHASICLRGPPRSRCEHLLQGREEASRRAHFVVWMPASLITLAHFAVSLAMKSRKCSGLSPAVVRPCSASLSLTPRIGERGES